MMNILLSNDDGIASPGLDSLAEVFKVFGKITVVAPAFNRSTSGHALSLHKPLRMLDLGGGRYSVDGSPADCTHLALTTVFRKKPDLIVSGINQGANLGQDVYYSGTVAAARELAISGVPAIAVSLVGYPKVKGGKVNYQYDVAARATLEALELIARQMALPKTARGGKIPKGKRLSAQELKKAFQNWPRGLVLNINVPNVAESKLKGFRLAVQGRQIYGGPALKRRDSRGQFYYWIGGTHQGFEKIRGTDCFLTDQNFVAITPLRLDCTDYDFITDFGSHFSG
jgi:5'-nucleotidase